ncbi:hypothetical protein D9758_007693 [Tetrapyrgos nigripes]|uniref:Cytochrome P450 n=1 Tax=Tetrapyrgos nigripes TaxID=182062 RepID=A0A8H5G5J7_9AGAR|nr:hypothetical protein D9758_007693 [Tetrapyrgos nigripes]
MSLTLLDYLLLLWGLYLIVRLIQRQSTQRFPLTPGPRGYPLIGNLLDIPHSYEWLTWAKLGEVWGDLFSLSVFGNTIVVVNSYTRAVKMLNEKNHIYSERPYVPMASVTCEFGETMGLLPNDRRLKAYRKMFHDGLGTNAGIKTFFPQEEDLAKSFIGKLMEGSEDLNDLCFHHSGAIILRIAYGYDVKASNDPMISISTLAMEHFSEATAQGGFLVNTIPFLLKVPEWFPGTGWKAVGKIWAKDFRAMEDVPFAFAKDRIAQSQGKDSFVGRWLSKSLSAREEKDLKHAAGAMFGAGSETTAITIYTFILMMSIHQDIQKDIQKEIDSAIGSDRLPTCEDKRDLPYLEAVLKEVKRFHTSVPCSLPHCTLEDDVHDGMFIPKGSIIIPNAWKMAHDPAVYKDPMTFDPTRFLEGRKEQDPSEYIFGFGRRICPGRLLADASIFITTAMIISAFEISPIPGEPPVYENLPGLISRVRPFKCRITARKDISKLRALVEG